MPELNRNMCLAALTLAAFVPTAVAQEEPPALEMEESIEAEGGEVPETWLEGWTGSISLGLNGTEGNSEAFSFRTELGATRETESFATTAGLLYSYAQQDSEESENRAEAHARNDWKFKESRWRFFAKGKAEYDEFQDWDIRLSAFAGPGYEFIDNDTTFLLGRVGLGVTREIGGEENAVVPEGLLGLDFKHQITERQKVYASVELFPALNDIGPYRAIASAGWEILVDPEADMTLKIGVEDRYDSSPGEDFQRNDISYFALLSWSF